MSPTEDLPSTAFARVRAWHAEGCTLHLDESTAYADLDENEQPLWHDIGELLARADARTATTPPLADQIDATLRDKLAYSNDAPQVYDLVQVVRAVLAEHGAGHDVNGHETCGGCSNYSTGFYMFWPCETVRAIARELRIEVPCG